MAAKELTKEQIRKAIKEKRCPFCEERDFHATFDLGGQDFHILTDGRIAWGEKDDDNIEIVECEMCKEEIPKEIWEKWKLEERG
ncbi:hypothetical protein ES703_08212 [subsurface metagenome]